MEIDIVLFFQGLRDSAPDFLNTFFQQFSSIFANPLFIIFIAVVYWSVNKDAGKLMLFGYAGGQFVNQSLKNIFCIYRPWILDSRVHVDALSLSEATGYSFPSGHTVNATGIIGSVAIWLRKHVVAVVICVFIILLAAFSRVWLGCHQPKDVIVAICMTALVLVLICFFMRKLKEHPNWDIPIAIFLFIVSAIALVYFSIKGYPMDYDAAGNLLVDPETMKKDCYVIYGSMMALSISWIIERRFIDFKMEVSTKERIVRAVVGAVLIAVFYLGIIPLITSVIPSANWKSFVKFFLLISLVVAAYPAFFGLMHRAFEKK